MATIKLTEKMIEKVFTEHLMNPNRTDVANSWESEWTVTITILPSTIDIEAFASIDPYNGGVLPSGQYYTTYSSLCWWYSHYYSHYDFDNPIIDVTGNKITFTDTSYKAAAANGVASYIMIYTGESNRGDVRTQEAFVGTVGAVGSGADVVIGNTTITNGVPYKFSQMTLNFPLVYTY